MGQKLRLSAKGLLTAGIVLASLLPAGAFDEIEVYNAEIADVGQFTIQHHFNYTFIGRTTPDFPVASFRIMPSTPRRNSPMA